MVELRNNLLLLKNRAKLEKMILEEKPYSEIVKQSQLLDKYVMQQIKIINKIRS